VWSRWLGPLLAGLNSLACGGLAQPTECSSTSAQALTNGVTRAEYLLMEDWEENAVAYLEMALAGLADPVQCTGVLIRDRWIVTAAHCLLKRDAQTTSAAFGPSAARPLMRTTASGWFVHPQFDVALVQLDERVPERIAAPLSVATELPDAIGKGNFVQIAGYGRDAHWILGTRSFLVERVIDIRSDSIRVSANGFAGACDGDSGGPLLVRGDQGQVELVAVLSHGAESCYGTDTYARLDRLEEWIEERTGAPSGAGTPKGAHYDTMTSAGRCFGEVAVWREGSRLQRERCDSYKRCGYDEAAGGYRCVPRGLDPCYGIDDLGDCDGTVVRQCADGWLRTIDCAICEAACGFSPGSGQAVCIDSQSESQVDILPH
jgi:hypothetical protein